MASRPSLLDAIGEPATGGDPAAREIRYGVTISYERDNFGYTYKGAFYARNARVAEENARAFAMRYLRPSAITDMSVVTIF